MGRLILVSGNDEFSVKEKAGEILRAVCGDPPEDNQSLEAIDGAVDPEKNDDVLSVFERLAGAMLTPPFLTPEKFVWLKHFSAFPQCHSDKDGKHKRKCAALERLAASVKEGVPDYLTLIIDGPGIDRRKSFFKICEKAAKASGELHWLEQVDPAKDRKGFAATLQKRIRELADANGMRIDPDAAGYIAETVGYDSGRLKSEIDKVCCFAAGRPTVSLEDCMQVCSRTPEAVSWEFSGALTDRDAAKAIGLIPDLVESISQDAGSSSRPEMMIVATVSNAFQKLIATKCECARFGVPKNANADYFYNLFAAEKDNHPENPFFSLHPFRAFKMWEGASKFKDVELSTALAAIFEANRSIVTGGDPRMTLEAMAIKISRPSR